MALTPFVPTPAVPAVTPMGATGGAGTFTAFDYTGLITAVGLQLQAIQTALNGAGGTDTAVPGSLLSIMAETKNQLTEVNKGIAEISKLMATQTAAMSGLAAAVEKATGNYVSMAASSQALQALALSETIKHNEFQVQVVNTSRAEADPTGAGGKPITVLPQAITARLTDSVSNIVSITGQITSGGYVTQAITEGSTAALTIAKGYISDTTLGASLLSKMNSYDKAGKQWYADLVANTNARITAAGARNTAAAPTKPGDTTPPAK